MLEVVAILAAIAAANLLRRRFARLHLERTLVAGLVLSASVIVLILSDLHGAGSAFGHARREAVGRRAGLEHCVDESLSGAPLVPYRHRFVSWVKARLPAHAVYSFVAEAGAPDGWCLTLVWLPALPAGPGARAGWTIAFGVVPPISGPESLVTTRRSRCTPLGSRSPGTIADESACRFSRAARGADRYRPCAAACVRVTDARREPADGRARLGASVARRRSDGRARADCPAGRGRASHAGVGSRDLRR